MLTFTCYMSNKICSTSLFISFLFYSKILKWIICDLHWNTTVLEKSKIMKLSSYITSIQCFKVILLLSDRFYWWGCLLHDVWSVYVVLVHFGRNNNCCQAACWKGASVLRTQCTSSNFKTKEIFKISLLPLLLSHKSKQS